jgi:hypothetical protein
MKYKPGQEVEVADKRGPGASWTSSVKFYFIGFTKCTIGKSNDHFVVAEDEEGHISVWRDVRPVKKAKSKKGLKCQDCGIQDETVYKTMCPYAGDVEGKDVPIVVCKNCYNTRLDDI